MGSSLIATVLWHDLFRFSRRAGRFEYWWGLVLCCLVYPALVWIPFWAAVGFAASDLESLWQEGHRESGAVPLLVAAFLLGVAAMVHAGLALLSLAVRRLHDMGQPGLFVLFAFVAAVNLIFLAVLGFARGEPAVNSWGDRPAAWPLA